MTTSATAQAFPNGTINVAAPDGLKRLRELHSLTDFTIVCGEREWRVHRSVLILHSKVLAIACTGTFTEAKDARLDLSHEPEEVVDALIHFLYSYNYDFEPATETLGRPGDLSLHAGLFLLGNKYDIDTLQSVALTKFKTALHSKTFECDSNELADAVIVVYAARTAARTLCIALISKLVDNLEAVLSNTGTFAFEEVIKGAPMLATDLARALQGAMNARKAGELFRCSDCHRIFEARTPGNLSMNMYCNHCSHSKRMCEWLADRVQSNFVGLGEWWQD